MNECLGSDALRQNEADGVRTPSCYRQGGVTAIEYGEQLPVFSTSGLIPEERQRLLGLPRGLEISSHLSTLTELLGVSGSVGYTKEVGLTEIAPQWRNRALRASKQ